MTTLRRSSSALAVLTLVTAAAACGGGGSKSTTAAAYVHSVCQTISSYESTLQAKATTDQQQVESAAQAMDYPKVKSILQDVIGTAVTNTRSAQKQVDAAGTPKVTNGGTIASNVSSAFGKAASELSSVKGRLDSLDASNASFLSSVTSLSTGLTSASTSITSTLTGPQALGSSALAAPRAKDSACGVLNGTAGTTPPSTSSPAPAG